MSRKTSFDSSQHPRGGDPANRGQFSEKKQIDWGPDALGDGAVAHGSDMNVVLGDGAVAHASGVPAPGWQPIPRRAPGDGYEDMTSAEVRTQAALAAADPWGPDRDKFDEMAPYVTEDDWREADRRIGWEWDVAEPGNTLQAQMIRRDTLKLLSDAAAESGWNRWNDVYYQAREASGLSKDDFDAGMARLKSGEHNGPIDQAVHQVANGPTDAEFGRLCAIEPHVRTPEQSARVAHLALVRVNAYERVRAQIRPWLDQAVNEAKAARRAVQPEEARGPVRYTSA